MESRRRRSLAKSAEMNRRRVLRSLVWVFLALLSLVFIFSGIGAIELIGDGLLALCLIKAGLKIHGHVIGGPPKAGRPRGRNEETTGS